jgi:hypothetical protein
MTLRPGDGRRLSNTEHCRPTLGSLRASDRGYRKASSAPLEAASSALLLPLRIGVGLSSGPLLVKELQIFAGAMRVCCLVLINAPDVG